MFMYFLLPHWVPATWRSRAQTSMRDVDGDDIQFTDTLWRNYTKY